MDSFRAITRSAWVNRGTTFIRVNSRDGNLAVSIKMPVGSPWMSRSMVTLGSGEGVSRSIPADRNARLLATATDGGTFHGVQIPRMYTGL